MYKAIIAIGVATAACLVAGCGGSGGGETAATGMTKAQFIKKAEAICSKTQEEGREARIALEKAKGEELELDVAVRRIVGPTLKKEAEELRSLTAPAGEKEKLTRMIDNLSESAAAFAAKGSKTTSTPNFEAFRREIEAYGLEACGV